MATIFKDIGFYLSCEVNLDLKVYIDHIDAETLPPALRDHPEDVVVTVRVVDGGFPFVSTVRATRLPVQQGHCLMYDEWLTIPIKIRDLPKTAQLVRGGG